MPLGAATFLPIGTVNYAVTLKGCKSSMSQSGAVLPPRRVLELSNQAYLGSNADIGVPAGVPLGNAPYTVAGWLLPDVKTVSRKPSYFNGKKLGGGGGVGGGASDGSVGRSQQGGGDGSNMEGMVGWGDFKTNLGSNAFATSNPSQFYNYWFSDGYGAPL
jgi:hypothetical protein